MGPRIGRYDKGKKSLPMGNPMSACMGLFILWWGWIGFNAGSSYGVTGGKWQYAARAGVGTTLATMGAGVFSVLFSMWKNRGKVDVFEVISGILASLGEKSYETYEKSYSINTKQSFSDNQRRLLLISVLHFRIGWRLGGTLRIDWNSFLGQNVSFTYQSIDLKT